jgi:hypothetical protein
MGSKCFSQITKELAPTGVLDRSISHFLHTVAPRLALQRDAKIMPTGGRIDTPSYSVNRGQISADSLSHS